MKNLVNAVEDILLAFRRTSRIDFIVSVLLQIDGIQVFGFEIDDKVIHRSSFFAYDLHHLVYIVTGNENLPRLGNFFGIDDAFIFRPGFQRMNRRETPLIGTFTGKPEESPDNF